MGLGVKTAIIEASKKIRSKEIVPIIKTVSPDCELDGRVALISGGSGGIGMAVARELLAAGAKVILGGTNGDKLVKCAASLDADKRCAWVEMDFLTAEGASASVSRALDCFDGKLDIFINSAGVHTEGADFWAMSPEEFDRVLNINLKGAFFASQAVAKAMVEAETKGHILFVNSCRGFEPAWSPYGISKWGLRGMTQGLARVLIPHGIVVNGIAPGSTATPLIGVHEGDSIDSDDNLAGRFATPEEIAEWARMLVGPTGDLVIGETLLVSGGRGGIDVR